MPITPAVCCRPAFRWLDFPFNTVAARVWGHGVSQAAGCDHRLHYLDVSDAVCKARLRARNARGEHPFQASEAEFEQITRYFVAPDATEGLNVVTYDEAGAVSAQASSASRSAS
nr:AAA family ATPase [Burkholderia pyrrocinia]